MCMRAMHHIPPAVAPAPTFSTTMPLQQEEEYSRFLQCSASPCKKNDEILSADAGVVLRGVR